MSDLKKITYHGKMVEVVEHFRNGVRVELIVNGLKVPLDYSLELRNFDTVVIEETMSAKEFKRLFS